MIWKINFIFILCSLHSFGLSLPQVQKRGISSTPNVTYNKDINKKVLGVLKKVYPDLRTITDSGPRSNELPRTYGMSLAGQQGFMWNMLNNARKSFDVGSPRGSAVKQNDITERSIPEEQSEPQESEGSVYLQIFSELLENDEFWDWLTGWIETYTELLDEHIKVEVEETVTKQIKEYFDRIDYLINEESSSKNNADVQLDDDISSGDRGAGGFVSTQNISNSTVYNEYVANIYFADPRAEHALQDKVARAILSLRDDKDNGAQTGTNASIDATESSVK